MATREEIAELLGTPRCTRCGQWSAVEELPRLWCFKCHFDNATAIGGVVDMVEGGRLLMAIEAVWEKHGRRRW